MSTPNSMLAATENFQTAGQYFGTPAGSGLQQPQWLTSGSQAVSAFAFTPAAAPTLVNGTYWVDSTQKSQIGYIDGIKQSTNTTIFTQRILGTALASSVTATSIVGLGVGTLTLPANFWVLGKSIRFKIAGTVSTTATPTLAFLIKIGSTTIVTTGAVTMGTVSGVSFGVDVMLTCYAVGPTATIVGVGTAYMGGGVFGDMIVTTAANVDTTAAGLLDCTAQWGTSSSSNTIQSITCSAEVLN